MRSHGQIMSWKRDSQELVPLSLSLSLSLSPSLSSPESAFLSLYPIFQILGVKKGGGQQWLSLSLFLSGFLFHIFLPLLVDK